MFDTHDQQLIFLAFMAFFELFRTVLGFWGIYKAHDTHYMFERHVPKLVIFAFMAIFVSYCPQFWGFGAIYKANDT
jgi:hypothetical protein